MFWGFAVVLILGWSSCEAFLDFDPSDLVSEDTIGDGFEDNNDGNGDGDDNSDDGDNDGNIGVVVSVDDPEISSCECRIIDVSNDELLIDPVTIPRSLPVQYDLSEFMPPVRSQGYQGSCVSWATSYYLKSYQEKTQYEYEYVTFNDVMSPSYVYNQVKGPGDCFTGSNIRSTLLFLQDEGVSSWEDFPYSDTECTEIPSEDLLEKARDNKIGKFFALGIRDDTTNPDYTLINLYKTLLSQNHPIVMSMVFTDLLFEYRDEDYVAYGYQGDGATLTCHAILIVGYDEEKGAFKFVNSWGSNWGNEGFGWLSYDFFRPLDDDARIEGYSGESYVVYDVEP